MVVLSLLALAVPVDLLKVNPTIDNVDVVCAAAVARYGNQATDPDGVIRNASIGAMQFFLGRLSVFDPHTNWAKLMSIRLKQMSFAEAAKLAPLCLSRAANLPFGDDALTQENGR